MHGFHSKSAEVYIIVKYRSSSILVIIHKILVELWPFFDLIFVVVLILVFAQQLLLGCIDFIGSLQKDISLYHCKIQVKFDIGNHRQNFGRIVALFRLSFLLVC